MLKSIRDFTIKAVSNLLAFCAVFACGFIIYQKYMPDKILTVEVPETEKTIKELIKENADKYNVNPVLIAAIAERESGYKPDAIRFESHHMPIAAKITNNIDEQRMYASSIGVMQIMAWHAPKYNMTYKDLFNNANNIEVGTVILKNCLDKHKGKSKYEQIKKAASCYNGSEEYGKAIVARLGQLLIENSL